MGWGVLNVVLGRLGTMAIGVVLARLLGPEAFGTYAVGYVALVAILSFNELGVSLAVVRWLTDPKQIVGTVNTISLVTSALLTGAVLLLAPAFTDLMGSPDATPVVRVLAANILVSGLVQTPVALLQREFRQRERTLCDQVNVWGGALVSLALAFLGQGAMSLAWGRLAGALISGVMFLRMSPIPYRLEFHREHANALLTFGLPLAGASVLFFAVGYSDQVVVSAGLGPTALGFYAMAFNLAGWPLALISTPLRGVAPAAFARLQGDPPKMRATFITTLGLLAAVSFPVCAGMAAAAGPLVLLVYGDKWGPSAVILAWLVIAVALRIVHELCYDFLVVVGASRAILATQAAWLIALVPAALWMASVAGGEGVAIAQLSVMAVVVLPLYLGQLRRHGLPAVAALRAIAVPAVVSVVYALLAHAVVVRLDSTVPSLLATAGLGVVAMALLVFPRRDLILGVLPWRRKRAPAAAGGVADG